MEGASNVGPTGVVVGTVPGVGTAVVVGGTDGLGVPTKRLGTDCGRGDPAPDMDVSPLNENESRAPMNGFCGGSAGIGLMCGGSPSDGQGAGGSSPAGGPTAVVVAASAAAGAAEV